jgi:NAD(P)H-dependent FMN reductase
MTTRLLTLAGSLRTGSFNRKLADVITAKLREQPDVDVQALDLADYPLPLYNGDDEARSGLPAPALALHAAFRTSHGVFIASPEYNAGLTPLLVNTLAWVSRVSTDGGMAAAFGRPVFAIGGASPGALGGYRGLMALRNSLELQLGARVLNTMISVATAHEAFDDAGALKNERHRGIASRLVEQLVTEATAVRRRAASAAG